MQRSSSPPSDPRYRFGANGTICTAGTEPRHCRVRLGPLRRGDRLPVESRDALRRARRRDLTSWTLLYFGQLAAAGVEAAARARVAAARALHHPAALLTR